MTRTAGIVLWLVLSLAACCNPPATQSLDSSFVAKVTAQPTPNQITVTYGSRPLTLMFEQTTHFEIGQELYIQGQIAGDVVKVVSATPIN